MAEVGGPGEVVVAGCSFMLMAIEKYEVRYSILSSLGDSLAESHSSRFLEIQIHFTRTRVSARAVSKFPHSPLDGAYRTISQRQPADLNVVFFVLYKKSSPRTSLRHCRHCPS
jgi:hypothetical protein